VISLFRSSESHLYHVYFSLRVLGVCDPNTMYYFRVVRRFIVVVYTTNCLST